MKKILTYGTFDVLHYGHIKLLKRAKAMGDFLVVGISSDDFNTSKGKASFQTLSERIDCLKAIKYIDQIIIEESGEQKLFDIKEHSIDIFAIGDDGKGKFDYLPCEVVYIERTPLISSSIIRKVQV